MQDIGEGDIGPNPASLAQRRKFGYKGLRVNSNVISDLDIMFNYSPCANTHIVSYPVILSDHHFVTRLKITPYDVFRIDDSVRANNGVISDNSL
jgi:hypothetical protein